jgi:hypothetical protein
MSETGTGTSGGDCGTSGAVRRRRILWLVLAALLFMTVQAVANVESTLTDLHRAGIDHPAWHVWTWELTSLALWLALSPAIWWIVARARPPRLNLPLAVLAHAAATVPLSVVHILGMIVLRQLVYSAMGQTYTFDTPAALFLYEYRKDAATYLLIGAAIGFAQWLLARPDPVPVDKGQDQGHAVLLVPDGNITHRVPVAAIESAIAAGNYVEIVWAGRTLLHRSTLAALAEQLGPGFARIHRGRLVRRDAVRSVETDKSGDFTVSLASGAQLRGSRRYRAGL